MPNPNHDAFGPQTIVTGRLKPTSIDTEIITFVIDLKVARLLCIVNVPGEGETSAPVYVKTLPGLTVEERHARKHAPNGGESDEG